MERPITPADARIALEAASRGRQRVVEAIAIPGWYWVGVGVGWIALGVIADLGRAWITLLATLVFGAVHAAVAPRVVDARHGTPGVLVRADVVRSRVSALVIGALVALSGLTVAVALVEHADGARHPTTAASVLVAVIVMLGGPLLVAHVRRRAARRAELA